MHFSDRENIEETKKKVIGFFFLFRELETRFVACTPSTQHQLGSYWHFLILNVALSGAFLQLGH